MIPGDLLDHLNKTELLEIAGIRDVRAPTSTTKKILVAKLKEHETSVLVALGEVSQHLDS
jgi:hypothetical protein